MCGSALQLTCQPCRRTRTETRLCVGQVQYFVKCTPRDEHPACTARAAAYGLPFTEPLRFALCHVYEVETVHAYERSAKFRPSGDGFTQLCRCLGPEGSRTSESNDDVERLLAEVVQDAVLLRLKAQYRVKLEKCQDRVNLGGIDVIAVALNAEWKDTPWEATPVVPVDPGNQVGDLHAVQAKAPTAACAGKIKKNGLSHRYFALSYTQTGL